MSDLHEIYESVTYHPGWKIQTREPRKMRTLQPIEYRPTRCTRRQLLIDALICLAVIAAVAVVMWVRR